MTIARGHLIDPSLTRWYHCVTRCVRRAYFPGEQEHHRKEWIENRLEELAGCFAVAVGGFSVMNNHVHVLLRLDPDVAAGWSDEEVVRRWGLLCPPRDKSRRRLPVTDEWVQWRLKDGQWLATTRERLQSISQLEAASQGSALGSLAAAGLEDSLWLCPIEDRRGLDSSREGMITGFPLGSYVGLVGYTARLFRPGKATISAELAGIFDRLGTNARSWQAKMKKLRASRLLGRVFAASQAKLEEIAERLNVRYVVNLARCPAR
jgi:hypothetical protein